MKKILVCFIVSLLFVTSNFSLAFGYSYILAEPIITVELDDVILNLSKNPIIREGNTLVPLREIANALNINVFWDNDTKKITCSKDDIYLTLAIDSNIMKSSEDSDIILDVSPILIDGTTYVPLKAISEALNCEVYWNGELQTVYIYSPVIAEDAALSSKLTKLSLYIYALNEYLCLDKGSYMTLAKVLKPEYAIYKDEYDYFSEIFADDSTSPFGKININYSNINSCEMKKGKKVLNFSENAVDVLITEIKKFSEKIEFRIPEYINYMSDIDLYEKYIENYAVREIDENLDKPYIFKEKYASAEKDYNKHIKKMKKFKEEYLSDNPDMLMPNSEKIKDAQTDLEDILSDVRQIYVNLGLSQKNFQNTAKVNIKPLIEADLDLTLYLKSFIKAASDLEYDQNGKTLKYKYSAYQNTYNSLYIKTLDVYSKLFNLNQNNPVFSFAFDTIVNMNNAQIQNCVKNINDLKAEWKYLAAKIGLNNLQ